MIIFNYCTFKNAKDNQPKQQSGTWEQFCAHAEELCNFPLVRGREEQQVREAPSSAIDIWSNAKKHGSCFSPAIYKKNTTRGKSNVQSITAYVIDLDGVAQDACVEIIEHLKAQQLHFCFFTTWGSGWKYKDNVALRIVVPFCGEVEVESLEVWGELWNQLNIHLANGQNDSSTSDCSRLHFFPRAPAIVGDETGWWQNIQPQFEAHEGINYFDCSKLIAQAKEALKNKVNITKEKKELDLFRKQDNNKRKWAEAYLEGICSNLINAADGNKHTALRDAAFAAGGLSYILSKNELRNALIHVVSVWISQGKRISDYKQAERTIETGLIKGSSSPIEPEPSLSDYEYAKTKSSFSDDDIEFMISQSQCEVIELAEHREVSIDETSEKLWSQFAKLPNLPQLFARDLERRVDFRQPALMLNAGLALCSAIASRRWVFDGLTSAQYFCSIAQTAAGKSAPQSLVREVLLNGWENILGPDDFSSSASFLNRVQKATTLDHGIVMVLDEYGPILKVISSEKNISQAALKPILLKLATAGTDSLRFATPQISGGDDRVLTAPCLSILASTTPEAFFEAVQGSSIADGFLGRHLVLRGAERLPLRNLNPDRGSASEALIDCVAGHKESWLRWQANLPPDGNKKSKEGNQITFYRPEFVEVSEEARQHFDALTLLFDEQRRESADSGQSAVLGRTVEQAKRIALCLAVGTSTQFTVPLVDMQIAVLALEIARHAGETLIHCAGEATERNDRKLAPAQRVLNALRRNPQANMRALVRSTHLSVAEILKCADQAEAYGFKLPERAKRGQHTQKALSPENFEKVVDLDKKSD